jgi:hypothetical protein
MKIKDCLSIYSHPGCALTLALMQGCPALDLKLLPGCTKLIPDAACIKSMKTWNCGPEYSGFNSLKF